MLLFAPFASAEAPTESPVVWNENTLTALVYLTANELGLTPAKAREMVETIRCESQFRPWAIGDSGKSKGLVQIHSPSWPKITDEQRLDPVYSIHFMAEQFKRGNEGAWTCWRKLYKM